MDAAMTLPPDRSSIATEARNPRSHGLHRLDVAGLVAVMNAENQAVAEAMAAAEPNLIALITAAEPGFLAGGRIVYIGAGTSGRLGVLDASEAPPTFQVPAGRIVGIIAGGDTALKRSSEGLEDDPDGAIPDVQALHLTHRDTVIGIAAGGTTPYVTGALRWCAERGDHPLTAFITCSPVERPRGVEHLVVLATGPEVLTGSTRLKAGTATKLALNTISTTLMVRLGKVYDNLMVDVRATNAKLRDRAARIVAQLLGCERELAFTRLDAANGSAKTAVVMVHRHVDREQAEALLAAVDGRLAAVLDAP